MRPWAKRNPKERLASRSILSRWVSLVFCCFLLFCPLSPIFSRSVFSNDDEDDADETNDTFYHHPTLPLFLNLRFWKSLIASKDYDTGTIDGIVSIARADFAGCTKLPKISATRRTCRQAEGTKNKDTSSRRNQWEEKTVLLWFKIHPEICWYR